MAASKYDKNAIRKPIYEVGGGVKNRQSPTMTYISEKQTGAPYYINLGWIYGKPNPNPYVREHVHNYDEILLFAGGDPKQPQVLGGEVEMYIGGQLINFHNTTSMYIPKGTPHGLTTWKKFEYPHFQMSFILGTGDPAKAYGKDMKEGHKEPTIKEQDIDYEQYVIRSPMREAGPGQKNRQSPTMTYMSRTQIGVANTYIEWGWIYGVVSPNLPKMVHDEKDEIVLHIGGDYNNPEDLGADLEFDLGDEKLIFDTTFGMWIPKGLMHGPLTWHKFRHPHIEMAIMLDCGTVSEGWAGSFFGPDGKRIFPGQRPPQK